MRPRRFPVLIAAALAVLSGCDESDLTTTPGMDPDLARLGAARVDWDGTTPLTLSGSVGPGAEYGIVVPPGWNGDLVVYAHGYVDPQGTEPLTPSEQALVAALPSLGYAVAYSSFSENGLAIRDGSQRTHQLRGIFASRVGVPDRSFLVGGSMGGLIALALAERFPAQYDGVLSLCGMVGGTQKQIDYVSHVRVLFDAFYPGVLPGTLLEGPALAPQELAALAGAAMVGDPTGAAGIASVMAATFGTPVPFSAPDELAGSIIAALAYTVRGYGDLLDRTHGHSSFDNTGVTYLGTGSPAGDAAFNQVVARYDATPDAQRYLDHNYEPGGDFNVPVVTLHNAFDPVVPAFHESLLAEDALAAGSSAWLVQQTAAAPYGHCAFQEQEVLGAFGAMVAAVGP